MELENTIFKDKTYLSYMTEKWGINFQEKKFTSKATYAGLDESYFWGNFHPL